MRDLRVPSAILEPLEPDGCRDLLSSAPGQVVIDDPANGHYPTAHDAAGRDDIGVSATCARVPVFTGHSVSANVQTREPLSPDECRELLASSPGLTVIDDPANGLYPTALDAAGRDDVLVGRIRRDPSHERCLNLWIVGNNLRKGAATNAVQVAELLNVRGLLRAARAA